jgi:hypothetical protein
MKYNIVSFEQLLNNSKRALLIGIGGGGDIVGTIPTAGLFKMFNIECFYAGLPWERSVIDPLPGPRKFDEILDIDQVNERIWIANSNTATINGIKFAESYFSELIKNNVYLLDLSFGTEGIVRGLSDFIQKIGIDLIVGIDVGGDCISFGHESGLQSPLADSMMVATLYEISKKKNTIIGVFGYGSDSELSFSELETSIGTIAQHGGYYGAWGITSEVLKEMEKAISIIPTEASRIPVNASKGKLKASKIRSGTREVKPVFSSNITYYLSASVIYEKISASARTVNNTKSLDEANLALNQFGLTTEYDLEIQKKKNSIRSNKR